LKENSRKPCKECPWLVKSGHNEKFKGWVQSLTEKGVIENQHRCHMIDAKGLWDKPTEENICLGRLYVLEKEKEREIQTNG